MAGLEEVILTKAEIKTCLWWRYIGGKFLLWKHGEEKLKYFIDDINKIHPTIKFTSDWSETSLNFLDVLIYIAESIIEIDLYVKLIYMLIDLLN